MHLSSIADILMDVMDSNSLFELGVSEDMLLEEVSWDRTLGAEVWLP